MDAASIVTQMQCIQTALYRVKNINRYLGDVRLGADSIKNETEGLRDEIRDALSNIEQVIHTQSSKDQRVEAAKQATVSFYFEGLGSGVGST